MSDPGLPAAIARTLRSPFVPGVISALARDERYLDVVWSQMGESVDTAGFLGSAQYMGDMALDAAEEMYQPLLSRGSLLAGALSERDLQLLGEVLDVFQRVQPQLLLIVAALAEGRAQARVGGQGRPQPRIDGAVEANHLATVVALASRSAGPLAEIAAALQLDDPPELYRAVAVWPGYLEATWDELQHLVAYPLFRQRGRALYFYARSSSRFLARPIEVSPDALLARGVTMPAIEAAHRVIEAALPATATMMMHCAAMRVGLGLTQREVVQRP